MNTDGSTLSRTRKWPGMPTPQTGTPMRRPTSIPSDGEGDRDADAPVEHLVQERVARVVVVVAVPAEAPARRRGGAPARRAWACGPRRPGRRSGRGRRRCRARGRRARRCQAGLVERHRLGRSGRRRPRTVRTSPRRDPRVHGIRRLASPLMPDWPLSGRPRGHESRQAGVHHGGIGRGRDLRRARRGRQPAVPAVRRHRAAARRPRRVLPREPPPLPRDRLGRSLRRPDLHGVLVAPHLRRARLHRQRLRRPGLHRRRRTRPTRPPRSSPTRRSVRRRLMLDGTVPGYESYEEAVAAQPADAARRPAARASTCSTRRARPGGPRACMRPRPDVPLGDVGGPHPAAGRATSGSTDESVYLSPAPLYHSAPLRFNLSMQPSRRARASSWSTSTPRSSSPSSSATGSRTPRSCRRCSSAC